MNIPLAYPDVTEVEQSAVLEVLKTPHLSLGSKLVEFENKFKEYIGTSHAIAVSSGTAGLHLAIRALDIQEGDEVITTPFSFIASANCILFEKAKPVFVDISPTSLNIDPSRIEQAITPKTKALIIVDVFGHPAEWDEITCIAKKHNLKIIEDACEALGSEYKNKKCGSFGDIAVFGFYPNKQITTGEGGMVLTGDALLADACKSMSNQGRRVVDGKWFEHVRLGYNYRMSELNAALGNAQLARIDEIIKKRKKVAELYYTYLSNISEISIQSYPNHVNISPFVFVIQLSNHYSSSNRDNVLKKLQSHGIQCSNYFQCIHLQPFYRETFGYQEGSFSIAESISQRTIALPFHHKLGEEEIAYIAETLKLCLS